MSHLLKCWLLAFSQLSFPMETFTWGLAMQGVTSRKFAGLQIITLYPLHCNAGNRDGTSKGLPRHVMLSVVCTVNLKSLNREMSTESVNSLLDWNIVRNWIVLILSKIEECWESLCAGRPWLLYQRLWLLLKDRVSERATPTSYYFEELQLQ